MKKKILFFKECLFMAVNVQKYMYINCVQLNKSREATRTQSFRTVNALPFPFSRRVQYLYLFSIIFNTFKREVY